MTHAAAGLSPIASLNETWGGIEQLTFMKSIAAAAEKNDELDRLTSLFQEIGKEVFSLGKLRYVTVFSSYLNWMAILICNFSSALPSIQLQKTWSQCVTVLRSSSLIFQRNRR